MKKRFLILFLALILVFQTGAVPALAEEITDPTADQGPTAPTTPEITFGNESILLGCRTVNGQVPLSGSERRLESAQSVFVYDYKTDTVVYSYNPDMKLSPGTLSKLMTAMVVMDSCEMDEVVVAHSKNISRLPAPNQNIALREGEEMTVEQMLYCMIVHGANDCAVALAEHIAGNMASFVTLMNAKAQQIGCKDTEFANVHGLDGSNQFSTARDMARIYAEVMKYDLLRDALFTTKYTVPKTNESPERTYTTLNYHIAEDIVAKYYDTRVTGGMTSYTKTAGASSVISAENKQLSLILVIIGAQRQFAENGWLATYYGNFEEMIELLEFSFNNFKANRVLYQGQSLYQLPVTGGECDVVTQPNQNLDSVLPADCNFDNLIKNVRYNELVAPIKKGDKVGTLTLSYRSSIVAETELFAMNDVHPATGALAKNNLNEENPAASGVVKAIVTVCLVVLGVVAAYLVINALRRAYGRARRRRRRANRRRSW